MSRRREKTLRRGLRPRGGGGAREAFFEARSIHGIPGKRTRRKGYTEGEWRRHRGHGGGVFKPQMDTTY